MPSSASATSHTSTLSLHDALPISQLTLAGHLLECGAQVTGGYFADPGFKNVPDLAKIGYPIAEIYDDASFIITKPESTGGKVSLRRSEEHTSELQSRGHIVCRLLLPRHPIPPLFPYTTLFRSHN